MITFHYDKIKLSVWGWAKMVAQHAFWAMIIVAFVSVLFGGILEYGYSAALRRALPKTDQSAIFNAGAYRQVLAVWQMIDKHSFGSAVQQNPFK